MPLCTLFAQVIAGGFEHERVFLCIEREGDDECDRMDVIPACFCARLTARPGGDEHLGVRGQRPPGRERARLRAAPHLRFETVCYSIV